MSAPVDHWRPQAAAAVVTSAEAKQGGLSKSLFERLIESTAADGSKIPSTMLNVQFRMHPRLAEFPNKTFYSGALENGSGTDKIPAVESGYWPHVEGKDEAHRLCFIDHKGRESKATTRCRCAMWPRRGWRWMCDGRAATQSGADGRRHWDCDAVCRAADSARKMLHNDTSAERRRAPVRLGRGRRSSDASMCTRSTASRAARRRSSSSPRCAQTHRAMWILSRWEATQCGAHKGAERALRARQHRHVQERQLSEAAYSRVESPDLGALNSYAEYLEQQGAVYTTTQTHKIVDTCRA